MENRQDSRGQSPGTLNRRALLISGVAAGVAAGFGEEASAATDVTVDVAVVGGGLSGLAEAHALIKAGRSVLVREAFSEYFGSEALEPTDYLEQDWGHIACADGPDPLGGHRDRG